MMGGGSSISLGRLFGIRIGATPSWFLVLFILIYLLTGYFGDVLDGSSTEAFWCAVAGAALFELSLVLHELGHALVARHYDVPITGIDLWFFGGLAKLGREPDTPGREFAVAIAGPAVTLVLIVACLGGGALVSGTGSVWDVALLREVEATPTIAILGYLGAINVLLLLFNILPAYPLDGGRMAMATAWKLYGDRNRGLRFAARVGLGFSYILMGVGVYIAAVGSAFVGIQLLLIGFFMSQSARAAVQGTAMQERMAEVTAMDLMDAAPLALPAKQTALSAQEEVFEPNGWAWAPVVDEDGHLLGLLHATRVDAAVTGGTPALSLRELVEDDARERVDLHAPLEELLASEPLRTLGALMVVDEDDRLRGVVTLEQVRRALAGATG